MSSEHAHTQGLSAAGRHRGALLAAFILTLAYAAVEVVTGLLLGSLALLSDAGHMLTDVVGLGMALAAIQLASQRRDPAHTYGLYRLEVLAAHAGRHARLDPLPQRRREPGRSLRGTACSAVGRRLPGRRRRRLGQRSRHDTDQVRAVRWASAPWSSMGRERSQRR